ncbi:superoxide dismutase, Cu-Zn family [Nonomuraea solani]|uniref:Superoxide dismutase, Cu-Zn family n=1 Tax=Nonomuraea solani TaxID=1144553 RepID=A0A1H6E716_9ACTN|nr:superoxide dismutase family protein [Nonomuraea solani]SEG93043.1 superoxide dismutase, Cu-Zn family [Nonomuraea solani]
MRVPALLLILLTAACAGPPAPLQDASGAGGAVEKSPGEAVTLSAAGEFSAGDTGDTGAIAYDRKLVPEGAQASVTVESTGGKTRTSLVVEGLLPDRRYGAHLHAKPCGKKPDESGPHFQHHPGQINPTSEVWLDVTTDAEGAGRSAARHDWALDAAKPPGSLVIHAEPTTTSGPKVGQAGPRVACLTLK